VQRIEVEIVKMFLDMEVIDANCTSRPQQVYHLTHDPLNGVSEIQPTSGSVTLIYIAAGYVRVEVFDLLFSAGADVNKVSGTYVLHCKKPAVTVIPRW